MHDDVVEVVSDEPTVGWGVVDVTGVTGALVRSPVEGPGVVVGSGGGIGVGSGVARVVVTGAGVSAVTGASSRDTRHEHFPQRGLITIILGIA